MYDWLKSHDYVSTQASPQHSKRALNGFSELKEWWVDLPSFHKDQFWDQSGLLCSTADSQLFIYLIRKEPGFWQTFLGQNQFLVQYEWLDS